MLGRTPRNADNICSNSRTSRRLRAEGVPLVEGVEEESAIGFGADPPLRQVGARTIRQQEIKAAKLLFDEPADHATPVGLGIDDAQESRLQVIEQTAFLAQRADDLQELPRAASPILVDAALVRELLGPVATDAEAHGVVGKELQPVLVQQQPIGLKEKLDVNARAVPTKRVDQFLHPAAPKQERFAAVQFNDEAIKAVGLAVLDDACRERLDHSFRHQCRP